jgi:hypothetical protein
VKAGDYHNPIQLNLEKYSVRKASHSSTSTASMNNRELQRVLG